MQIQKATSGNSSDSTCGNCGDLFFGADDGMLAGRSSGNTFAAYDYMGGYPCIPAGELDAGTRFHGSSICRYGTSCQRIIRRCEAPVDPGKRTGSIQKTAHMLQAKDYVIYRMTGQIVTDYSDASGTNLFDIREKRWSQELLNAWEIPASILSELHPSTDIAGTITQQAALETGLLEGTPVVIGGGDGSCACVGAGGVQDKQAYCVLGSSSWISAASREPVFDPKKRTLNWVHLAPCLYTPCGTMQAAGYSYRWFCNTLCDAEKQQVQENEKNVCDILNERVKHTPAGAGGLLYLPYLLGERSPRWDSKVRGAFLGLSVTTGKAEMARAVMEGVGMNLYVILQALKTQVPINRLALIGGGAQGDVWPQILADIWGMPVETAVHSIEATSMGAAICAGVGIGLYRSFREAFVAQMETRVFNPDSQANAVYRRLCPLFEQAYESLGKVSDGLALFRESAE